MNKNNSNLVDLNNLSEENNNLNTASTNMLVNFLANSEKLVNSEKKMGL